MSKQEKNKQIVIIIGAGASADFRLKKSNESMAKIINITETSNYEIRKSYSQEENIKMPTGEELVQLMTDRGDSLFKYFCFDYFSEQKLKQSSEESIRETINAVCEYYFKDNINSPNRNFKNLYEFIDSKLAIGRNIAIDLLSPLYGKIDKAGEVMGGKNNIETDQAILQYIKSEIKEHPKYKHYFDLSELVKYYQPFSIDELLDSIKSGKVNISPTKTTQQNLEEEKQEREELVKAGKTLIALFLLKAEDKRVFTDEAICWYRHLRNLIINSGRNAEEIKGKIKNLTIISFNYDRSLDYFLRTKLGKEFCAEIKIIYPYGKLAQDDFDDNDYKKIKYGEYKEENLSASKMNNLLESAKELSSGLRVIGEFSDCEGHDLLNLEKDENYCKNIEGIKKKLGDELNKKSAEDLIAIHNTMKKGNKNKFYFLGFGFHEENCSLINLKGLCFTQSDNPFFYYTNYGNSKKIDDNLLNFVNTDSDLFRENYRNKFSSNKGVYDALAQDFDLRF